MLATSPDAALEVEPGDNVLLAPASATGPASAPVAASSDAPLQVLRNVAGDDASAVLLRVLRGGRDAVGAKVEIEANGTRQTRLVGPAYSYLASNDPRLHVGLAGGTTVERVTVTWPGGEREEFGPLEARTAGEAAAVHKLEAGAGRAPSGD